MRIAWTIGLAVSAALLAAGPADAAPKMKMMAQAAVHAATGPQLCNGTFSNGASIDVANPANEIEVGYVGPPSFGKPAPFPPINGQQVNTCDVHTFAWNQFIYLTANDSKTGQPRFMGMAPWYNVLKADGSPKPGAFPGGPTDLETAMLDQGQAGNDDHLLDVDGNTVRYDIRFDPVMYGGIVGGSVFTQADFKAACAPDAKGNCSTEDPTKFGTKMWLPPQFANERPEAGSIEVKTAWRDFGAPGKCPSDFYCQGRFGLVGFHYVNKTFYHGEWIWATFEHVANDPDCMPGGETPIAEKSPINTPWSFFNPKTVPKGVMSSKICSVSGTSGQCNTNPRRGTGWVPVNVCRTISAAAGGASPANCAVNPSAPNAAGNIACLNATLMPQLSGPWRNYKLVGAVWVQGGMGFMVDFRVQGFQTPMPGFVNAVPAGIPYLANTTMETWFQHNSTTHRERGATVGTGGADAGCFLCHNLPSAFVAHNKQMDLSHFPGKLPGAKLAALKASLIRADSTVRAPK